jgi:predicted PurR-regulated permease PerM
MNSGVQFAACSHEFLRGEIMAELKTSGSASPPDPNQLHSTTADQQKLSHYTVVGLMLLGLVAFVPLVSFFFSPLVLAATFAALFYPIYHWLFKRLWHNGPFASIICCLVLILCVLVPSYILIYLVVEQAIQLYKQAAPMVQQIIREGSSNEIIARVLNAPLGQWLQSHVNWESLLSDLKNSVAALGKIIVNRTYAGISGVAATLVVTFFILFYLFFDGLRIVGVIKYLLPIHGRYKERIFSGFIGASRATVKGILIIGIMQGALSALTLLLTGIKSWLLWGFVCVVFSVIPVAGAHIILIPAGLIQIISGHFWKGIVIILVDVIVIASVDNVLRPRLVGRGAKMHDLIVFFSSIGGLSLFGITGIIIGPALASFFLSAVDVYKSEFKPQLDRFERG